MFVKAEVYTTIGHKRYDLNVHVEIEYLSSTLCRVFNVAVTT